MNKSIFFYCLLLMTTIGCLDDDPKPSCFDPDDFKIPSFTTIVNDTTIISEEDGGTYWVCNGGSLTVSGKDNLILVDTGGIVVINGIQNEAFNLEGGLLTLNAGDNEVWLNGDSKTYVNGYENQLYHYVASQLIENGDETYIDEICANVKVDFSEAPQGGCQ